MVNNRRLKKHEFNKGIDQVLIQDFYRGIETHNGVMFNKIKVLNIVFVKFHEAGKTYMFENPFDERINSGYVCVESPEGEPRIAKVISSIKLPRKYLKHLQLAMFGGVKPLKKITGLVTIKTIEEVKENTPTSMEFVYDCSEEKANETLPESEI